MLNIDEANEVLAILNHNHNFEMSNNGLYELKIVCENCGCAFIWGALFRRDSYSWLQEQYHYGPDKLLLNDKLILTCEEFKMKEALE